MRIKQDKAVPWINLSGEWLKKAGFDIGQEIKVTIREQLLIIEIISEEKDKDNLNSKTALKAVKKQLKKIIK